ncbi:MAG: M28 family peptidase [Candidatus Neomarinimicrobiota bacterium]|jgi:glutaminyl-peptide cyclotransferase|nr:M28 family peptidase [Candidatus Neomarinimicrobiota bacterium]MEC7902031.1 M28 family peptidase [Candidatus Neomarinimicrobiota bacterium]|tara:strand:- start:170 stop:1081 length:912 start_codon:yes stop_codon:yes gene_type:complete
MKKYNFTALLLIFTCVSCQPKSPLFSGENAFQHLIKQCSFGPRNPGSEGHKNTLNYYLNTFKGLADTVFTQSFEDEMPRTRAKVKMNNVIAQFNRESNKQIMISAHWDTRPWADTGSIMKKEMPILGANDGASGVAVIIELAYIFKQNPPPIGVSLVLFDAEDYGVPGDSWTYCKGSQYFARNLPISYPEYGINIDMIADRQPEFYIERISYQQNASLVLELWELSEELGLKAFKKQAKDSIFDDHVPLYEIAGIPAINIIDFDYPNDKTNYWHTHNDIVQNCSPNGLYQVGTLLVNHIYNKK